MNSKEENSALSEEELLLEKWEKRLRETGVPLEVWGKGKAKILSYLTGEISRGSAVMYFDDEREIWIRKLKAVEVEVFFESPDGISYFLREDRQIFKDGRERRRGFTWVAEKVEGEEDFLSAAVRGVEQELSLVSPFASEPKHLKSKEFERESDSYPGLITEYSIGCFEVYITPEQFNSGGYVEEQEKLTTFFVWEKSTLENK